MSDHAEELMGKRVGIVAAVNGGMQRDREGAKVPITPEQIAEDAALCFNEGAAVVHICPASTPVRPN
jgi:3-keto-5-aminohexanoate cleavage enzyme